MRVKKVIHKNSFSTHSAIENCSFLTPSEKTIEGIVLKLKLSPENGNTLRLMSALNEELKSSLHYHSSAYIKHLIKQTDDLIKILKS